MVLGPGQSCRPRLNECIELTNWQANFYKSKSAIRRFKMHESYTLQRQKVFSAAIGWTKAPNIRARRFGDQLGACRWPVASARPQLHREHAAPQQMRVFGPESDVVFYYNLGMHNNQVF